MIIIFVKKNRPTQTDRRTDGQWQIQYRVFFILLFARRSLPAVDGERRAKTAQIFVFFIYFLLAAPRLLVKKF